MLYVIEDAGHAIAAKKDGDPLYMNRCSILGLIFIGNDMHLTRIYREMFNGAQANMMWPDGAIEQVPATAPRPAPL